MIPSSEINGLVLAGGSGSRMGRDKATLDIHGMPQWQFSYQLLKEICENVWVSLRPTTIPADIHEDQIIFDEYENLGPVAGILSAFKSDSEKAWYTLACDLPLVDEKLLEQLLQARNKDMIATAFWDKAKRYPEPLICIWEPRAYGLLMEMVNSGFKSPRKVLLDGDTNFIQPQNAKRLLNLNYPEDLLEVQKHIAQKR